MNTDAGPRLSEVGPLEAWEILSQDAAAVLVDVRTRPEWGFVGGPDLSEVGRETVRVEWSSWPGMVPDPGFVRAVMEEIGELPSRILFICRSGARSMQAAQAVAQSLPTGGPSVSCINVAEGFEGDLDTLCHRGGSTGWKARGLAWRQS